MKKYTQADTTLNNNVYKRFMEMGLDDGWTSSDKIENFEQFLKICEYADFPIQQASVLDVGCGTGDFAFFLQKYGVKKYVGIDIFENAVKKARLKYPFADFLVGDFLELKLEKYDFVYSSGAITAHISSDHYQLLGSWVKKMWDLSLKGVVFNVLLERYPGEESDEHLYLYNRLRVLEVTSLAVPESKMKVLVTDAGCGDGTEELHVYLYR